MAYQAIIKKTYKGYCVITKKWTNCPVALLGCYSTYRDAKAAVASLSGSMPSMESYMPGKELWNFYLGKYKDCEWLTKL